MRRKVEGQKTTKEKIGGRGSRKKKREAYPVFVIVLHCLVGVVVFCLCLGAL